MGGSPQPSDMAAPDAAVAVDLRPEDPGDLSSGGPDLSGPVDLQSADLAAPRDLSAPPDLAPRPDLAMPDLATPPDLARPADLSAPVDLAVSPDMAYATSQDVDIYVDNRCVMDVIPKVFNVPRGTFLKLSYHNRSRDYKVDIWMSYGGGFTDLMPGATWAERFEHNKNPQPNFTYADISTGCSSKRQKNNSL